MTMNTAETSVVVAEMERALAQAAEFAVATIVSVSGSTYRRPGARLLVTASGNIVGNLSGGCLEGDVQQLASQVMATGESRLQLYDLTADDEAVWGWGLGCNGTIEIFIEGAATAAQTLPALREVVAGSGTVAMATVVQSTVQGIRPGLHAIFSGGSDEAFPDAALNRAAKDLSDRLPPSAATTLEDITLKDGHVKLFLETFVPRPRLLVCGAGHDAIPLVRAGAQLGLRVVVVDDRKAFLSPDRFEEAEGFVLCKPGELARAAALDERTFVMVMSHNYLRDRDYLYALLGTPVSYIGMLGPKARTEMLLADLRDRKQPTAEDLSKLHGPAGLDIGAEGPEEIAASIVAEILAVERGRAGGSLTHKAGSIHERATDPGG